MSRVAKAPIVVPSGVEVTINADTVCVKGPKGQLEQHYNKLVSIELNKDDGDRLIFSPAVNDPAAWKHAGTVRAIVNNMIQGVTVGFMRTLELVGVGYRAQNKDNILTLSLGFSHPIEFAMPDGIVVENPNNTTVILKGIDKQRLGQVASEIRAFRPPEPYKGKGVKYANEYISRKEAKKK